MNHAIEEPIRVEARLGPTKIEDPGTTPPVRRDPGVQDPPPTKRRDPGVDVPGPPAGDPPDESDPPQRLPPDPDRRSDPGRTVTREA